MKSENDIRAYWNQRASLGETAGTQDLILKQLEQKAILSALREYNEPPLRTICEVGCGRGEMARLVAAEFPDACVWAMDFAPAMIEEAKAGSVPDNLVFEVRDILLDGLPNRKMDAFYTERCLINLPTWQAQRHAIEAMGKCLTPDGVLATCEHSQQGLGWINHARKALGLSAIVKPWHNVYLDSNEARRADGLRLEACRHFSATYYYHSRVLNAKLARDAGLEPAYDSLINSMALSLPDYYVNPEFAQARLWIWRKA